MVADVPPDQAFTVGPRSQVFVAKRHGGAHRLTGRPGEHVQPVWSPEGKRVAVVTHHAIEIRSASGHVLRVIRDGARPVGAPAWAPDGQRIAFLVARPKYNLAVVDLRSGRHHGVDRNASSRPSWSPDGRTLFYLRSRRFPGDRYPHTALFAAPARGGTPRRLARNAALCVDVLASPTGEWVLFKRDINSTGGLWIVRPDGSGKRRLIPGDDCPGPPTYEPPPSYGWTLNGRAVYSGKSDDGHPRVRMLSGESVEPRVRFSSEQYAMSLDGGRVAWVRGRYSRTIRYARADGRDDRELARFESFWGDPGVDIETLAWSPDGRRLAIEAVRDEDP